MVERKERRRFVFIVTYGRSGSTLLQNLIGAIPGCHMTGENNDALYGLYLSHAAARRARDEHGRDGRHAGSPWWGAHRIRPARYAASLRGAFVSNILQPPPAATMVGLKEVRYFNHPDDFTGYLDFIRGVFAPARFVFNSRNHDEVSRSAWYAARPPEEVLASLRQADAMMDAYQAAHPGICYRVHYNDYVADRSRLRSLYAFLGAEMDEEAVRRTLATPLAPMRPARRPGGTTATAPQG